MPIYEYACQACGAETEILQKLSDPPETKCPACGKKKLVKQVSAAGFRLSGGGWYETDFKSDGKRNLAGDKDESKKSEDKKSGESGGEKKSGESGGEKKADGGGEKKADAKADKPAKKDPPPSKKAIKGV